VPRWLTRALARIHAAAERDAIRLTYKAEEEARELGLSCTDAAEVVSSLTIRDFARRISSEITDDWMYVFLAELAGRQLYIKVVLRAHCVVVSFHEDQGSKARAR
jgi:hypothetical protein